LEANSRLYSRWIVPYGLTSVFLPCEEANFTGEEEENLRN